MLQLLLLLCSWALGAWLGPAGGLFWGLASYVINRFMTLRIKILEVIWFSYSSLTDEETEAQWRS